MDRVEVLGRYAEIVLIECAADPDWERRVHLIVMMEAKADDL